MHIRVLAAAGVAASLGSAVLAGCSSSPATTVYHTPALQTNGGRATARTMVQTAIIATTTSNGIVVPGGGLTPATAMRTVRAIVRGRRGTLATGTSTGACTNGTKQSQVTNSDGTVTTTADLYYDAACTTLENEEIITVAAPANGTTTASGTLTTYNQSQTVTSSHVLALSDTAPSTTTTNETITMTDNAAASVGGATIDQFGVTCVGVPNAVSMTCSSANYGTVSGTTTGESLANTITAGSSGAQNTNAISASFFLGSEGIALSSATWSITNTTSYDSGTGTFSFTSAGQTGAGTLSLADSLYTYAETGTLGASGMTLTIVQNPNTAFNTTTQIATATVDAGGNGSATYSDGTVEPIWGSLIGV